MKFLTFLSETNFKVFRLEGKELLKWFSDNRERYFPEKFKYDYDEYLKNKWTFLRAEVLNFRNLLVIFKNNSLKEEPIAVLSYVIRDFYKSHELNEKEKGFVITYIDVLKDFRRIGLSKILIEDLFKLAKEKKLAVLNSEYVSSEGKNLSSVFKKFSDKYGVKFLEHPRNVYGSSVEIEDWDLNRVWLR